jgi:hypothetical protein
MGRLYGTDLSNSAWALVRAAPASGEAGWAAPNRLSPRCRERDPLPPPNRVSAAAAAARVPAAEHSLPLLRGTTPFRHPAAAAAVAARHSAPGRGSSFLSHSDLRPRRARPTLGLGDACRHAGLRGGR